MPIRKKKIVRAAKPQTGEIGYYYKFTGIIAIGIIGGFLGYEAYRDKEFTVIHLGIVLVLFFLYMLAVRGEKFQDAFETVMDKMPFVKYSKEDK